MNQGEQQGFTIIEVILFLAISAMLLVIALTYSGNAIRNARFSDATRSMESFLQEQFTRVQTNSFSTSVLQDKAPTCSATPDTPISTVTDPTTARGSSNCLLLGLALDFQPSGGTTVRVIPILGVSGLNTPSTATNKEALVATNPQVWLDGGEETYTLPWSTEFTAAKAIRYPSVATLDIQRVLFVRGVRSGVIDVYVSALSTSSARTIIADTSALGVRNAPTILCITTDNVGALRGVVQIEGRGDSQGANISGITSKITPEDEYHFADTYPGFAGVACS